MLSCPYHHFFLQRCCQVYGSISLSVCRPSLVRPFHQFFQYIRDMYGILWTFGHLDILTFVSCNFRECNFPGNATSRERWRPGKGDFQEIWLPGNQLPGKGNFISRKMLNKVTSQEMWLPGKGDFLEKVTSWKKWFLGNLTSWEIWLPGN